MEERKTGISRDLIIHPGETIGDILEERGITQAELALRTGVSPAYVSNIIAGKKNISLRFAGRLEYALGVPKSFWLNLQANYDSELMDFYEAETITEEERTACSELKEVIKYLQKTGMMQNAENDEAVLALRKVLQISSIANLKNVVSTGAFRMAAGKKMNPYVLGAWVLLCQISGSRMTVNTRFDVSQLDSLIAETKNVMFQAGNDVQRELRAVLARYGIDFSVMVNFRGAPVQGFISQKADGSYQMVLTIRGAYADIFWFSLFHELAHIVNGDTDRAAKFIDSGGDAEAEAAADCFARDALLNPGDYSVFVKNRDFSIEAVRRFADSQRVMPYIVIGRLQKERLLDYRCYSEHKLRYRWAK